MRKIVFCILDDGRDRAARETRAAELARSLQTGAPRPRIEIVFAEPGAAYGLLAREPDGIVAVGYDPADLLALGQLACPLLWDMGAITRDEVEAWLAGPEARVALSSALAIARGYVEVAADVALAIEDGLKLGLTTHGLPDALAAVDEPVVVIMGTGLGNMIYALPMLRWLSERLNKPIDLVIHNRFPQAVTLFARAPWINAVYPGFEYLVGRRYKILVSSITAGSMRPPFTGETTLWIDQEHGYNEDGRFLHETRLNFLGLERIFPDDPGLEPVLPLPFIRDIAYRHPGEKVIGIANGKKAAAWAKREWPHMHDLVQRLNAEGWEVRSFGLPDEYVEGARDFTQVSMRDMLFEIAKCSYFISYDGGICHMAEAIGVPTIWLFGSTGSVKNGPIYAHSPVILSRRPCGPCMYKVDWLRCESADCMAEIPVDAVAAALDRLHEDVVRNGYHPKTVDPATDLLAYEVSALRRPGPASQWRRYLHERTAIFADAADHLERIGLGLLAAGDMAGLADIGDALTLRYPDRPLGRFYRALARQIDDGPTPLSGLLAAGDAPLLATESAAVIAAVDALAPALPIRRAMLHAGLRYWMQRDDRAGAAAFALAAARSETFPSGLSRPIMRYLERFGDGNAAEGLFPGNLEEERISPSLLRMRNARFVPLSERLDTLAGAIGKDIGLSGRAVRQASFAPLLPNPADFGDLPPVRLEAGPIARALPQNGIVLVIAPHVRVKSALPGSTSSLIMLHVNRLALLGLRPVVVTIGFDDIPDGWTMRDSVTFIQGHALWSSSAWETLVAAYPPNLVLAYGDVESRLALPASLTNSLMRVSLDGLMDRDGLVHEFPPQERFIRDPACAGDALAADVLSQALFCPPPEERDGHASPLSVTVLVADPGDVSAFVTIATGMPSVRFTVLTAQAHRGIEKNLNLVAPGELAPEALDASSLLIQFSTRRVNLAAETIGWIERGGRAIAAPTAAAESIRPHCAAIDRPADPKAWFDAIRGEGARMAGKRRFVREVV